MELSLLTSWAVSGISPPPYLPGIVRWAHQWALGRYQTVSIEAGPLASLPSWTCSGVSSGEADDRRGLPNQRGALGSRQCDRSSGLEHHKGSGTYLQTFVRDWVTFYDCRTVTLNSRYVVRHLSLSYSSFLTLYFTDCPTKHPSSTE